MKLYRFAIILTLIITSFGGAVHADNWLDSTEADGIAYFLFVTPARIERYDINSETWLTSITLTDIPTAFAVDGDGIYVSFGRRTSRFALDGTGEIHLKNTVSYAQSLLTMNEYLYIHFGDDDLMSVNKYSGLLIESANYFYSMQGLSIARSINKIFARSSGVSPADIMEVGLLEDGTLGTQNDSLYHGDYPSAAKTFLFPGDARVTDSSGIIYNTSDLTYSSSFAGSIDELAFYADLPVVLRGDTLIAYSNEILETGRYVPQNQPGEIYIMGEFIFSFFDSTESRGVNVSKIPISLLEPANPGQPVNPNGLAYTPDVIELGSDGTIFILSKNNLSIFRWSFPLKRYIATIALVEAPTYMTYSANSNSIFLAYNLGKITKINATNPFNESPFVNSPQSPLGLATAGEYLFVCDPSGAWVSHFTYSPDGELISQIEWNYFSEEYIWNDNNKKMYFFRDDTSPNDLIWENIDSSGVIGDKQDSPYHGSEGFIHPIRVAPDGSSVVLGSGRIYDALTLQLVDALSNDIDDAVWANDTLYTIRFHNTNSQLQKWSENYALIGTAQVEGTPIRMFNFDESLLVIAEYRGAPYFSIWDLEFKKTFDSRYRPRTAALVTLLLLDD